MVLERARDNWARRRAEVRANREEVGWRELVLIFMIGCLFGTIWEVSSNYAISHVIENRAGVVYGPFNPVYGFGAVVMTLALRPAEHLNGFLIFLLGSVVGGAFEYACSLFQEITMGTVSWDYSDMAWNIGGRTNVPYMFFWGLLAFVWVRWALPLIVNIVHMVPSRVSAALALACAVFMVFNMVVSMLAMDRLNERHNGIAPANALEKFIDERFPDERVLEVYPNVRYVSEEGLKSAQTSATTSP